METCPVRALKLVSEAPPQMDINGYDVNLAPPPPETNMQGFGFPKTESRPATEKGGE